MLAPLAIFDVTGELFVKLYAFLKIDLLLFSIDWEKDITPEATLLDFNIPFTRIPTLATELGDGVLRLNMGEFSDQRLEGNEQDIGEQFYVAQLDDHTVRVWAPQSGCDRGHGAEVQGQQPHYCPWWTRG